MSGRSSKKQRTGHAEKSRERKIDIATESLSKLLRKPLLVLLGGAEPGEDESELDRWWTLDDFSNVSPEKLHDISECFSTLTKLRKGDLN